MITIVAKNCLKPGMKQAFMEATLELIESSRNEEGNISYDLYEEADGGDIMCFIENWRDGNAIKTHFDTPHFKQWLNKKESLVENSEVVKYVKLK